MGQKINPISLRLGNSQQKWNSIWHTSNNISYGILLFEDIQIKRYLTGVFENKKLLIHNIKISRKANLLAVQVDIYIPFDSKNDKVIDNDLLTQTISNYTKIPTHLKINNLLSDSTLHYHLFETKKGIGRDLFQFKHNPYFQTSLDILLISIFKKLSARLVATYIAKELENTRRHVFFLTFIRRLLKIIMKQELAIIKGIRIDVKGRLNGADRSRKEIVRYGSIPLQTLSADIDFYLAEAFTIYGTFGVKVWISYKK